jgi:hypothetical protein
MSGFVLGASRTNRGSTIVQRKHLCKISICYMCVDCRQQHQLTCVGTGQRLKRRLFVICRNCEVEALSKSTVNVASDELLLRSQDVYSKGSFNQAGGIHFDSFSGPHLALRCQRPLLEPHKKRLWALRQTYNGGTSSPSLECTENFGVRKDTE